MLMLTAFATVDYVATRWTPVAFRSNDEPVHLACRIAGPYQLSRYSQLPSCVWLTCCRA